MKGRTATPLKIHSLESAYRPQPPATLSKQGKRLWRKLAAQIDGLQAGDVHALRLLVEAILNARQQRKLIGEEGEVITPPNGTCYLNPRYKLVSEYEKTAIRLLKEFGLSPASRRRTGQRGTDNSVDELEAFIG